MKQVALITLLFRGMLAFSVAAGLGIANARADKLDEYKKAKGEKNCKSIPDSNRQEECRQVQADAKSYCDEFSCDGLSYKDNLSRANAKKETLSRLENEIRELDSKISSAKDDDDRKRFEHDRDGKKRDLEETSRDLTSLQKEIDDTKIQINGRIAKGERCRHYRIEVQKIFLKVEGQAESDGQSNEEIKKIVTEDLIPHWHEEGVKHSKAIEDSQTAVDKCQEKLEGKR